MSMRRMILTVLAPLGIASCLSAAEVPLSTLAIRPEQITQAGSGAVFVSRDLEGRHTLWFTDGTAAGTRQILDPCPSPCNGTSNISILGASPEGKTYFVAADLPTSLQYPNLWVTDGTPAGTHTILSSSQVSGLRTSFNSTNNFVGNRLVFVMLRLGETLWSTGGTASDTGPVAGLPEPEFFDHVVICAGGAHVGYFQLSRLDGGIFLGRTNGHSVETLGLATPGSLPGCMGGVPVGDRLMVVESVGEGPGSSLWITNGTVAGSNSSGPLPGLPYSLEVSHSIGVFLLREGIGQVPSLWSSDATPDGTHRLKQGVDFESFEFSYDRSMLEIVGNFVYYLYHEPDDSLNLRRGRLDGTADQFVQRVCSQNCPAFAYWVERLGDDVVFPGQTESLGTQIFRIAAGETVPVRVDFPCTGFCEYQGDFHQVIGARLILSLEDEVDRSDIYVLEPAPRLPTAQTHFSAGIPYILDNSKPWLEMANGRLLVPAREDGFESEMLFAPLTFDTCFESPAKLCLRSDRFRVSARWRDFAGREGAGQATVLTGDTGYFWFFDSANVELTVKVVDGTALNEYFWIYYGALSNVEYWITVEDTITGESREYHNPLGSFGSFGDITALPEVPSAASLRASGQFRASVREPDVSTRATPFGAAGIPASCIPSSRTLCLLGGRFSVEAAWTDFAGNSGVANAEPLTADTGYFWFFNRSIVEVVTKLVDGSNFNDHFWVYYGALSNVEYTITVTDTVAGGPAKQYHNALGQFGSLGDITAFPAP